MKYLLVAIFVLVNALLSSAEVPAGNIPPTVKILSVTEFGKAANEIAELRTGDRKTQSRADVLNLNSWADGIISIVARNILRDNLDPVPVSGYTIKFDYRPLLITYSGTLTLTQGSIQELSSVTRGGNVLMTSDVLVTIPLRFSNIILSYNFEMNVRGDTVTGVLYTWLTSPTASYRRNISPTIESYDFNLSLGSYEIFLFSGAISSSYRTLVTELSEDVMRYAVTNQSGVVVSKLLNELVSYEDFQ